eukprot:8894158-Pyramimonas_sp.AAC.1
MSPRNFPGVCEEKERLITARVSYGEISQIRAEELLAFAPLGGFSFASGSDSFRKSSSTYTSFT